MGGGPLWEFPLYTINKNSITAILILQSCLEILLLLLLIFDVPLERRKLYFCTEKERESR